MVSIKLRYCALFSYNSFPHPQLVELKNGETFNGHLVNCDNFMNITLREVYQTSPEGDRFVSPSREPSN